MGIGNEEHIHQALSIPIVAKEVTRKNRQKIANHLLDEILSLREDMNIKPGDTYILIVRVHSREHKA